MSKVQTIKSPSGEELVILPRADYDKLLAAAQAARRKSACMTQEEEDAATLRIIARSKAALARGDDVALPLEVWDALEAEGASPVRILRKHRSLTQVQLAVAAGVSQSYVTDIEKGRRTGTVDALKAIAKALAVPLDVLAGN